MQAEEFMATLRVKENFGGRMVNNGCEPCNQNPCGSVTIVQGMSGSFYADLIYQDTKEPFDLTGATEIVASFPGQPNPVSLLPQPVLEKLSLSQIAIIGANGAGKIQINYLAVDSFLMQLNPNTQQFQDLQVVVTKSGVAQIDTISLSSPTAGVVYSILLNGQLFTYTGQAGDTSQLVFNALLKQISASPLVAAPTGILTGVVSGSGNSATLVLTATFAGLGFNDVVTNLVKTPSTANAGTRSTFLLQATLNIVPQTYQGS